MEQEALMGLYAVASLLKAYDGQFSSLTKRVPNGYRDYRLMYTILHKLLEKLFDTVPPSQLNAIYNRAAISEIKMVPKSVTGQRDDHWLMTRDEIEDLVNWAAEGKCTVCSDRVGRKCKLRKMMEELPVDINTIIVGCKGGL